MQVAMTLPAQFPVPMPAGSLDSYIQTINRFPLLSLEQEQQLARRYR
ncbi:MAG: RNA polymerase sigma factor RpoH, partial [Betaproteobacteria bacterium]|nr:RNA polymerase sigma factor RpoH [Betaproteobacteria bacterium]